MNIALLVCNLAFVVAIVYKFETILKHLLWINDKGPRYRRALDKLRNEKRGEATARDIWELLSRKKFQSPYTMLLGVKEFRIKNTILNYKGRNGQRYRILRTILRAVVILYDFATLGLTGGLLLVWTGLSVHQGELLSSTVRVAGIVNASALAMTLLLLTIEPTVVYNRLGSYATAFQGPLRYVNSPRSDGYLQELVVLVSLALAVIYVDTAILSFLVNSGLEDFGNAQLAGWSGIFHCCYAIFMTFVFASPISPSSNLGQAAQLTFTAQGIFVIVVALIGLAGIAKFPQDGGRVPRKAGDGR